MADLRAADATGLPEPPAVSGSRPSLSVRSGHAQQQAMLSASNTLQYYHATPGNPFAPAQIAGPGTTHSG
jgi:hypothetical protein